jgi:cation transport regulator ChaC
VAASGTWVFGYGSLVAPSSVARTVGRPVGRADGFAAARLHGFGRRWNYGSLRQRADWHGPHGFVEQGIVVSLGLEPGDGEVCNGAVVRVTDDELALLDWRESDYERTDVTERVVVDDDGVSIDRIVTYVPRPSAVDRYRTARDELRAAIRHSYVRLVDDAFAALGGHHLDEYRAGTPAPDVPVVDFS